MSDMSEVFGAMRERRRRPRAAHAVDCPRCREVRPKAPPTKLLPQQTCRVDGYTDPRPRLTKEQKRV